MCHPLDLTLGRRRKLGERLLFGVAALTWRGVRYGNDAPPRWWKGQTCEQRRDAAAFGLVAGLVAAARRR